MKRISAFLFNLLIWSLLLTTIGGPLLFSAAAACLVAFTLQLVKLPSRVMAFSIGALTASTSDVFTLNDTPANLQIGTVDTDLPLSSLSVSVRGKQTINITAQARIQAFGKWLTGGLLGADVKKGMIIRISDSFIAGVQTIIRTVNAGATTPQVYINSPAKTADVNTARLVYTGEQNINPSSSLLFQGFSALFFDSTNLDTAEIEFSNGFVDRFTAAELDGLNASAMATTDADGKLAGLTTIDNSGQQIASVRLYTTSTAGGITVLEVSVR